MKSRDKVTELLLESMRPVEDAETDIDDANPTPNTDAGDIDAIEARIWDRIEQRLAQSTPNKPQAETATEGNETESNE